MTVLPQVYNGLKCDLDNCNQDILHTVASKCWGLHIIDFMTSAVGPDFGHTVK